MLTRPESSRSSRRRNPCAVAAATRRFPQREVRLIKGNGPSCCVVLRHTLRTSLRPASSVALPHGSPSGSAAHSGGLEKIEPEPIPRSAFIAGHDGILKPGELPWLCAHVVAG